jgi:hypothetical protein
LEVLEVLEVQATNQLHSVVLVLVLVLVMVAPAMNHHHSNHPVLVSVLVVMMLHSLVEVLEVQATNQLHSVVPVLVLDSVVKQALFLVVHHPHKFNNMLRMLKVSSKTPTHKSSVAQLPVVFKHTLKTSECDSFNHHQCHPQAHSSSEKCDHLNHLHHHHFAFVNKLHLFLNHPHSFSVNDHHNHQHLLLHKQ